MRLGIDFGTTRTVVAMADRGNYPVVSFQSQSGDTLPWYPALIAAKGYQLLFGLAAATHQLNPQWSFLRSIKPLLAELGPDSRIRLGDLNLPVLDLLTGYLSRLRLDLRESSNVEIPARDALEICIAVPANANSNQRFLTLEAFRRAGFRVTGMINEPSAAGIEYAQGKTARETRAGREYLLVYDLGGGTFDASVIGLKFRNYEVVTDQGISRLGGNDFDEILLEMALARLDPEPPITPNIRFQLLEECRRAKEALHPNSRKIVLDASRLVEGAGEIVVPVDAFYERCAPLVNQTVQAMDAAVARSSETHGVDWDAIAAVYLVGGSSDLPIVGRTLRERYGRRVRRSPYPYSATAIGLAISSDVESAPQIQEKFTRYFGVWREAESGHRITFDPIFRKDTPLPAAADGVLMSSRRYTAAHNVGHFRYLECSGLTPEGQPDGDITPWDEIRFVLDPALREETRLEAIPVRRTEVLVPQVIEERYSCDAHGMIEVVIANQTAGYERSFRLRKGGRP